MSVRLLLPVFVVLVLSDLHSSTFAEDVHSRKVRGWNLNPEQAASLEKKLEQDPHDLASRAQLLEYYSGSRYFLSESGREAKRSHVLWLIHNRPEAEALMDPSAQIFSVHDPEGYVEGKNAWMNHLQRDPANLRLLEHAANFFQQVDHELSIELLQRAQSLDENNPKWPEKLGFMYSLSIIGEDSSKAKTEAANKALAQFERAYELSDARGQDALLEELAKMAFEARQYEKAREYARALLAKTFVDGPTEPRAITATSFSAELR